MPGPNPVARILVIVDLSSETDAALRCADDLRRCRPATIDVYYLWPEGCAPLVDAADRAMAAAESLSRSRGALERLDRLSGLERAGDLALSGWMVRVRRGGDTLANIAAREGYQLVVAGIERPAHPGHLFAMQRHSPRSSSLARALPANDPPEADVARFVLHRERA